MAAPVQVSRPALPALSGQALGVRLPDGPACSPEVREAWELIRSRAGDVSMREVAAHTGWSLRRLERRFGQQVGLPPHAAAGVLRLQRALALHAAGCSWARAAADAGYFDQSHFGRSFTAMVGCTPRQFHAARTLEDVTGGAPKGRAPALG